MHSDADKIAAFLAEPVPGVSFRTFDRWLIVANIEHTRDAQLAPQARLLEDARRALMIGGVWPGLVILFWAYGLSRSLDRHAGEPPNS